MMSTYLKDNHVKWTDTKCSKHSYMGRPIRFLEFKLGNKREFSGAKYVGAMAEKTSRRPCVARPMTAMSELKI